VSWRRVLLLALLVVTAVLLQVTVMARLPLPGRPPDLVLVVVLGCALAEGERTGVVMGFAAGLFADLQTDHELGRLALVYLLAGYLAGRLHGARDRSTLAPFAVVAAGALGALGVYFLEGIALGDPRTDIAALRLGVLAAVTYDVVLTPFVVPAVVVLLRRVEPDPLRL
jgi:rod shape-determining protein MreD